MMAEQERLTELISHRIHKYYWTENLSCAAATLKILSEQFRVVLHPQIIDGVLGLNAGRFGSQCGLAEGALLFIGIYGKQKGMGQAVIIGLCHQFVGEFVLHFNSLLCSELRPQGFGTENPPHLCEPLTNAAVTFALEFVAKEMNEGIVENESIVSG